MGRVRVTALGPSNHRAGAGTLDRNRELGVEGLSQEHKEENGANPELGTGEDATLAGYFSVHNRPPAFEGCDGQPYTVSMETERTPDLNAPVSGYLVFPRWAETGLGIVGHVESPLLWRGRTRDEVLEVAGRTTLQEVQRILNEAIAQYNQVYPSKG